MRTKHLWIASAAIVLALPAIAQETAPQQPGPAATSPLPQTANPTPTAGPSAADEVLSESGSDGTAVEEVSSTNAQPPSPPVEYPGWARRDPFNVGPLNPDDARLTSNAWGEASGQFLSILLRRMQTPIA